MGNVDVNKTDKLIREIIGAYRATQSQDLEAPDQIKHLRYQVARLVRLCIELNRRILELKPRGANITRAKAEPVEVGEELDPDQITSVGDII